MMGAFPELAFRGGRFKEIADKQKIGVFFTQIKLVQHVWRVILKVL